jgi:hypothetical protein
MLKAQNINKATNADCDSLSKKDFFSIAKNIKRLMDKHYSLSILNVEKMVKIYNTIYITDIKNDTLNSNHFLEKFRIEFDSYYYNILKKEYDLKYDKGGTLYLSKIDLYIGIGSTYGCKDIYIIH